MTGRTAIRLFRQPWPRVPNDGTYSTEAPLFNVGLTMGIDHVTNPRRLNPAKRCCADKNLPCMRQPLHADRYREALYPARRS